VTDILALDLATTCGWARGVVDADKPTCGSIIFGKPNASSNAVFANCLKWISETLEPRPRPELVIIEAMLPAGAKVGDTTGSTRDRLAGLHAVVRAVAYLRAIPQIATADVRDVRNHFIGHRTMKRREAKAQVYTRCAQLGWPAEDYDAADALALWSYARSLIDPKYALLVSPLFNKALRIRVQT
jgi:hypothetical protein